MSDNQEVCMAKMQKDIEFIKITQEENNVQNDNSHKAIVDSVKELKKTIDEWIKLADGKYAIKSTQWAEPFILWIGAIIGTPFLVGLVYLIAKGYIHLNK